MAKYNVLISNIVYDLDGLEDSSLPHQMHAEIEADDEEELEDYISDYISDTTGFCHLGFTYTIQ